ncbi:MAG: acylphosphatase [Thomasclavelia sp.]|jgi:acylphosphatase|nr:acylphosphatase [Thomasclavelia sp.]
MIRVHIYFSGIVQGVGFRYRCYNIASQLGLTGWARNLYDGRVECELQGSKNNIEDFISNLKKQPFIDISNIEQEEIPTQVESGFNIVG